MTISHASNSDFVHPQTELDIFISYSRKDKAFVETLVTALKQVGRPPWIDWEAIQPTEDWWEAIQNGIEGASTFVFVITPDSVTSPVCRQEIEYAVQHNKRIVPIVRQEGFHSQAVHSAVSRHNWLFFRETDDFDSVLQTLITAIDTDLNHVRTHTRLLRRAREWQTKEFDSSFLLRGSDLADATQWLTHNAAIDPQPTDLHRQYITASHQAEEERQAIELRLRRMTPQQYRNRQALLSKVTNYWVKGVLEHSLQNRVLIGLGLEEYPDAVAHSWNIALEKLDQPSRSLPQGTRVVAIFDQLGEGRTLLILGEPGAGKTTTLLELARDLLTRAEQGIDYRIPVIFNLSSWIDRKQTIAEWLVEELNTKYQVPQSIGQIWVQEQHLLLLLDGLDEVRAENRDACVAALNSFQQQYGSEMVVCSRIKDYEALTQRLNFQCAIYVRSLTPEQVNHYLNTASADLTALKTLIAGDKALQELARSPLMLNIMALSYQGTAVEQLPTMNLEERRHHLFNLFINRMFKRRGSDQRYSQQQAMHWLTWLAQRMTQESQSVFLIEGLQPKWLQSNIQKKIYQIAVSMMIGLFWGIYIGCFSTILNYTIDPLIGLHIGVISGLIAGFITGAVQHAYAGRNAGWISGLIAGFSFWLMNWQFGSPLHLSMLIFALGFGIISQRVIDQNIDPVDSIKWSWSNAKQQFIIGTICELGSGIVLLIVRALLLPPKFCQNTQVLKYFKDGVLRNFLCQQDQTITITTLLGLLALGLFVGAAIAVILGFKKVSDVERRTIPNQGIWKSAINAGQLILISGSLGGLLSVSTWFIYYYSQSSGSAASSTPINSPLIWWLHYGNQPLHGLFFGINVAMLMGLATGLVGGEDSGLVCLQHFVLRVILWMNGYIPWNYARFLNYAAERILLQKVGGGYIFVHRLLLEHFAQLQPQQTKNSAHSLMGLQDA